MLEKRFQKVQDDFEAARQNLVAAKHSEKDIRDRSLNEKTFFEDQLKVLAKQRTALVNAYKKQLMLLDNLKRQNVCLEQAKLIEFAEKDFVKMLDFNSSS